MLHDHWVRLCWFVSAWLVVMPSTALLAGRRLARVSAGYPALEKQPS